MKIPKLGKITPYPFQWEVIENTKDFIRKQLRGEIDNQPSFIHAYVSAGKTIIAGALAVHCQEVGARMLILARTGELVEQDADEVFNMGGACSLYSASLGQKSVYYSTVVGTEGTVANALDKEFASWVPHIILIDECFTGETMITTRNGEFRIDDPALKNQEILCVDEATMNHYYEKPVRTFSNGVKSVSRVRFKGGEIKCTSTHRIWSQGLWVKAKDLKAGQKITLSSSQDFVLKKLLRASVAVAKKLAQYAQGQAG